MPLAFVAGATGYTGRAVVHELIANGVETVAHIRPDSPKLEEYRARFTAKGVQIDTTPWQLDVMTDRLAELRPTQVFLLLGTTKKRAREAKRAGRRADYAAVDVGLSILLIDAALRANIAPRVIYLSSLGVSPRARGAYLRARYEVERHLEQTPLSYLIARPSFISGPDRDESRPLERVAAVATDGMLSMAALLGARGLKHQYASMTSAELARALVKLGVGPNDRMIADAKALRTV